jgi:serine-type D-Ala-D-Ala carboxypeptidase/endopeptidase (penicillin-binding protein 4)
MKCCSLILLVTLSGVCATSSQDVSLKKWIDNEVFDHAQLGISVIDVSNMKSVLSWNADIALIPASSLKIVTTLSALSILGSDYQYNTEVYCTGEITSGGVLYGDLVIRGSGDPSLGSPDDKVDSEDQVFEKIIRQLRIKGITCIDGDLICDNSLFDSQSIHNSWPWDDLCNYYASGTSALNFRENYYEISFQRTPISGAPTKILDISPKVDQLSIENGVSTGPPDSGDNAYLFGDPYSYQRVVRGTIPPGSTIFKIKGAIPNAPEYFLKALKSALDKNGIGSNGVKVESGPLDSLSYRENLLNLKSPRLRDIVQKTNFESNNLYSESIYRTLGSTMHQQASFDDAQSVVEHHIGAMGLDISELQMKDGSGLSPSNRVTPHFLSLFVAHKIKSLGINELKYVVPQAGEEGSVRNLLKGKRAKGSVWLKSGSISGVLSYTGFIITAKGNSVSICIIANGHTSENRNVRRVMEDIIEMIYLSY